jgi:hypothetical protein
MRGELSIARKVDSSAWVGETAVKWAATERLELDTSLVYVRGLNETDGLPLAQQPPFEALLGFACAADRWSLGGLTCLVTGVCGLPASRMARPACRAS